VGGCGGGRPSVGPRPPTTPTTTIDVPDEPAMRQHRAALLAWAGDSVRIESLNMRLSELVRITVRVGGTP
jgi:hypothetical protein